MRGIGPARARALAAAGYRTVEDLLYHLPSRYEDRRAVRPISQVTAEGPGGPHTLEGRLSGLRLLRTRRRGFNVVHGTLTDETGSLPVAWFNRPYLPRQVAEGREYVLNGPVREARGGGLELLNPSCEPAGEALHGARVVPVYPAVRGLGAPALRRLLAALLEQVDLARVAEPIPDDLRARHGLPALGEALAALHLPDPQAPPEAAEAVDALNRRRSPGHLRLIYGELLEHQVELALLRALEIAAPRAHRYRIDDRLRQVARSLLPFPLTNAQKRALAEIAADLGGRWPMLRLLQGDVGSGKTIVAALALVIALESGLQGAFMAPTELLAEQHHANLRRLLGERYRIGLLTGSNPEAPRLRAGLAAGDVQLAVGTHALIQEGVAFRRLGLAVIDEQHRFGVAQRQLLAQKGERPDLLVMTATPIPRSLALTAYGDLEVSVLDELPPGRRPVATEVQPAGSRREVYGRLAAALAEGARAFVVFPTIEGSEAASLAEMGERVRRFLGEVPCVVVHGRLSAAERDAAMRAFAAGEARVLLATTVIEVGVDVPEATWMVIEGAERFGLSQLHQLRGRVGRGREESRCVAITHRPTAEARERLEVFAATTDGFRIAEADLAQRGPGDLLGTRQAGLPTFRAADLLADREWLEIARSDARELLPRLAAGELEPLRRRLEPRVQARAGRLGGG